MNRMPPLAGMLIIIFAYGPNAKGEERQAPSLPALTQSAGQSPQAASLEAEVDAVSEDQTTLLVRFEGKPVRLAVGAKDLQARLKGLHKGDRVLVAYGAAGAPPELLDLAPRSIPVGSGRRLLVLLITAGAMLGLTAIVLPKRFRELLVGQDGRYSKSKFQAALWFGTVMLTYVAFLWLRWREGGCHLIGGVNIPQNLLLLSGMSAFTFAAAKGITSGKQETARAKALVAGLDPSAAAEKAKNPAKADERRFLNNMLCDDKGIPDIGDFQMLVVTLMAVSVYFAQVYCFLGSIELLTMVTIPDVDTTILAMFGLGQGAYLTKKYAAWTGDES
jgi:hypothetical protein